MPRTRRQNNADISSAGLSPIGDVVSVLQREFPEVTQSSLRFFERIGLLEPARTPGGHRLYTPADVARVRQIKRWQAERLSLAEIRGRLAASASPHSPAETAREFLQSAIAGDADRAVASITRAAESGLTLEAIFTQVLAPALVEVGDQWERGELAVGQEKEISEIARAIIAELSSRHAHPRPVGPIAVGACVTGELHELGLRMVVGLLRERGWRTHYLGADVAVPFLMEAVRLRMPDVVLLSASAPERLLALVEAILALRSIELPGGPPTVVVGGKAAREHASTLRNWGVVAVEGFALEPVLAAGRRESPAGMPGNAASSAASPHEPR